MLKQNIKDHKVLLKSHIADIIEGKNANCKTVGVLSGSSKKIIYKSINQILF